MADYFTMYNELIESQNDQDLGSGGILLLPDLTDATNTTRHLAVGAGKDGNLYVVDRDNMGKFNATANNNWQVLAEVTRRRHLVHAGLLQPDGLLRPDERTARWHSL